MKKTFEYKTINRHLSDASLNGLGETGWELVTQRVRHGAFESFNYVFKRETFNAENE